MIELDLALQHGEFSLELAIATPVRALALFGHSGCGKTSTLLAMAGLLHPRRGHMAIDGHVLFDSAAGIDLPPARRNLGVVFQDARLFPHLSVRDNLRYGMPRDAAPATFDDAVSLLGLSALLKRKPGELSGGQARRVAIGRALLRQPHALLLDEPLANLHREARAEVLQHLVGLKREFALTTLMVSHQHDEVAALADAVALIDDGRLAALQDVAAFRGTPAAPYAAAAAPERCTAR
ncbi:MAG: Molybdenum ABC transporter ATP-binding protein ModC [Rhodanobacteraceae bacterium]|jgi:molybdate transport system ATP-binding protein|nr:MAG: Molybdenum ABC transporter ATP-binding protein ModC [Rhodanobacteraceae bacterium]